MSDPRSLPRPSGTRRVLMRIYWMRHDHLCSRGWHWPIKWSDSAYPGSYDPPQPPEPGFACEVCGKEREPYRAWWWDVKRRWYERRIDSAAS